ncbi:polar amino acid uptake transporter family protein [Pseudomonas aeruginosa]|nr:polar amino acid uptake transporter family protein [Pseudomonas aeruginosa]
MRGVRKAYGEQLVVMDDMNLDMRADDRLVIIGPSGSGKSSLLRVLMGLEGIQGGTISFQGKPYINGERRHGKPLDESLRTQIGMVFQHYTLFPHLSVLGNLILAPCRVRGWSRAEASAKATPTLPAWAWKTSCTPTPASFPAARSSAWRSLAR